MSAHPLFIAVTVTSEITASFSWDYMWAVLSIVLIDIVLAGDNAVVIALAVHTLPPRQRLAGIVAGSGAAVLLRVGLTFVATRLLAVPYLMLAGGALIVWIAFKLLRDNERSAAPAGGANHLWQAVWMILLADVTMSLDNVLAVAGAAGGNVGLLVFGLALSIPLVVFASNLLSKLMDRWPVVIDLGAALLGKVGVGLILTDPHLAGRLDLAVSADRAVEWGTALAVLAYARWHRARAGRGAVDTRGPTA